jgi:hypothetical protein
MNRVTLSKMALLAECGAWARADAEWHEHSMYEAEGNAIDKPFAEYIRTGGNAFAFTAVDDDKLVAIWRATLDWLRANYRVGMRAQVVFAYDARTGKGREIEPAFDAPERFYAIAEWRARHGIAEHEVCGSADLVYMGVDDGGAFVAVDDLKVRLGPEVKDATAQLSGLALAACRAYGVDRARIRTLEASERGITPIEQWLDDWDLSEFAGVMSERLAGVETAQPNPGEWCTDRYCPHIASCSAKQQDIAIAETLVPVDALVRRRSDMPLTLTIQSPDHAADILARAKAIERVAKMAKDAVEKYIGDGVTLSDGDTLKPTFRRVPRVNNAKVEQLARDKGATDEELALCITVTLEGAGIRIIKAAKKGRAA